MFKSGFSNEKYVELQSEHIRERVDQFGGKLYLEFGGKLFDDYHASRVLPGFEPDSKIRMLKALSEDAEIVIAINADAIEKSKRRGDLGITYDQEVLRLIDAFTEFGLFVGSVVITQFAGQPLAEKFETRLRTLGVKTYRHYPIEGYPSNLPFIVSEDGYGKNDYIETSRPLVVITAPGPGSGKMATCLSQLYHENKRGVKAGYAKFETFPVWNLPLKHPVNLAYEAATADIDDKNMIDYFHLEKYGETAVNYNRDLETFPVLREILTRVMGQSIYNSPTDMGVNMIGKCIVDDNLAREAAKAEIVRRYYRALVDLKKGLVDSAVPERIKLLMNELGVTENDRTVAKKAEEKRMRAAGLPSACIAVGRKYIMGRKTGFLSPVSSTMLNAIKYLTKIPDEVDLIASTVLEPILEIKNRTSNFKESYLKLPEVLMALSICSTTNPIVKTALDNLEKLKGAEFHATHMITDDEMVVLSNLGISATSGTEADIN